MAVAAVYRRRVCGQPGAPAWSIPDHYGPIGGLVFLSSALNMGDQLDPGNDLPMSQRARTRRHNIGKRESRCVTWSGPRQGGSMGLQEYISALARAVPSESNSGRRRASWQNTRALQGVIAPIILDQQRDFLRELLRPRGRVPACWTAGYHRQCRVRPAVVDRPVAVCGPGTFCRHIQ
jgi:hypothetical protein